MSQKRAKGITALTTEIAHALKDGPKSINELYAILGGSTSGISFQVLGHPELFIRKRISLPGAKGRACLQIQASLKPGVKLESLPKKSDLPEEVSPGTPPELRRLEKKVFGIIQTLQSVLDDIRGLKDLVVSTKIRTSIQKALQAVSKI